MNRIFSIVSKISIIIIIIKSKICVNKQNVTVYTLPTVILVEVQLYFGHNGSDSLQLTGIWRLNLFEE